MLSQLVIFFLKINILAKGQDPSLINIPKGLQGLAKSFKRNFSEKKTVEAK